MLPYLVSFCATLLILAIIQSWPRNSVGYVFWSIVALLIPCLLAGMRADSIGTDVAVYAKPLFDVAHSSSSFDEFYGSGLIQYWSRADVSEFEIGYLILVWISSRLFDSVQGLLFLTQLLVIVPIYWTLSHRGNRGALAVGMCLFLFLYFNQSLNMMRQWIAMAFVFAGVVGLYKKNGRAKDHIAGIASILIGISFHTSAVLGLAVFAIRVYMDSSADGQLRKVVLVCGLMLIAILFIEPVASLLTSFGLGSYVAGYLGNQSVGIMPNQIIMRLPLIIIALMAFRRTDRRDSFTAFLLCMTIAGVLLSQLTSLSDHGGRIGLYFDVFALALPSVLLHTYQKDDATRLAIKSALVVYALIYWAYFYVFMGSSETVPYLAFWS